MRQDRSPAHAIFRVPGALEPRLRRVSLRAICASGVPRPRDAWSSSAVGVLSTRTLSSIGGDLRAPRNCRIARKGGVW